MRRHVRIALMSLIACTSLASASVQEDAGATAQSLLELGRTLVPQYAGEHRALLKEDVERRVAAASHLFSAALELDPQDARAMWWKAHATFLLGENQHNRDMFESARIAFEQSEDWLTKALNQDPDSYWSLYARGMAHNRLHSPEFALRDLRAAIAKIDALALDEAATQAMAETRADAKFVRFKCMEWIPEVHMDAMEFREARAALTTFYAENGNNQWDLAIATLETFLRERKYASAREHLENALKIEEHAAQPFLYEQLGYIHGIVGDDGQARRYLDEAQQREWHPSIYLVLWEFILSDEDGRADARQQLAEFVRNPPADAAQWDLGLGRLLLGEQTAGEFEASLERELARRSAEALDFETLGAEAWFYMGVDFEFSGEPERALTMYDRVLDSQPSRFNWEWEYARRRYALLCKQLSLGAAESVDAAIVKRAHYVHRMTANRSPRSEVPAPLDPGDLVVMFASDDPRGKYVGRATLHMVVRAK